MVFRGHLPYAMILLLSAQWAGVVAAPEEAAPAAQRISEHLDQGVVASRSDRYRDALTAFSSARALLTSETPAETRFVVFNNLGRCHAALNRYASAYRSYREALTAVRETDDIDHLVAVSANFASLCVRMGRAEEALNYSKLVRMLCERSGRGEPGENMNTHGTARFLLGEYEEAEKSHRAALQALSTAGAATQSRIIQNLAADLSAQGKHTEATQALTRALAGMLPEQGHGRERRAVLEAKLVLLQLRAGQDEMARSGLARLKGMEARDPQSHALEELVLSAEAEIAHRAGDYAEEARLRSESIEVMGGVSMWEPDDLLLRQANAWRYLNAADAYSRAGDTVQAMRWLEQGRRAEEQRIAAQSLTLLEDTRLLDMIEDCATFHLPSGDAQAAMSAVQQEKAFDAAMQALRKAHSGYWEALFSRRLNVHPEEMNQLSRILPQGVTFVEPVVFRDRVALFVCSKGRTPSCTSVSIEDRGGDPALRSAVAKARILLSRPTSQTQALQICRSLNEILIAPIAEDLVKRKTEVLLISPVGFLRYVPFCALFDGKTHLVERYSVANITGLDLIRIAGQELAAQGDLSFVGFANPDGSLPGAASECQRIAKLFDAAEIVQGDKATLDRFFTVSGDATFVHLSTHGILDSSEPSASHLVFAAGEKLTYDNMIGMPLLKSLRVLTMSACNTASPTLGDGAEMSGMAYQFIRKSNAGAVVASQWQVDDRATEALMVEFYRNMRDSLGVVGRLNRAASLAQAQRALLAREETKHPFYWAGFMVIGDYR